MLKQFCILTVVVVSQICTHNSRHPHYSNASCLTGYCTAVTSDVTRGNLGKGAWDICTIFAVSCDSQIVSNSLKKVTQLSSLVTPAKSQVLNSHMWPEASVLSIYITRECSIGQHSSMQHVCNCGRRPIRGSLSRLVGHTSIKEN